MRTLSILLIPLALLGCKNPPRDVEALILGTWHGSGYYSVTYEVPEYSALLNDTMFWNNDSLIHMQNVLFHFSNEAFEHNMDVHDFSTEYHFRWYKGFLNFHPTAKDRQAYDPNSGTITLSPETDIPSGRIVKLDEDSLVFVLTTKTYSNGNQYYMQLKRIQKQDSAL